ncbi:MULTISPECIES: glutathione S-transferase family protein [Acetobacteraceae]|jgi:glutathione S-transferase|uniref:glutathione S-transferase family protein n=1 Tax=Acetobacteraceae TaxID=433 RepID=UPI0020A21457|nr:glutathione S-transferase [Acetobacter orientalis]MCP1216648.1 glutathione S-transferase [Acetobacter orientalis]MCP1219596.1 glutathione S-transferase [Acetobacter orientalis]
MKLYDYPTAPNPWRVRFFIAEKGLTMPTVTVDLAKREQFTPTFRALNPCCTVPVLELDDGTAISEVPVICRYLEDRHPDPPLMGDTAEQRAIIGMWDRRMEIDGYLAAMEAVRNNLPGLSGRALVGPHSYAQIPELAARGRQRLADFMADLDARLHNVSYVAGDTFSIADITAFVTLDFARSRLKLELPDEAAALRAWFASIAERPSAQV